jgi:hypothetical protein
VLSHFLRNQNVSFGSNDMEVREVWFLSSERLNGCGCVVVTKITVWQEISEIGDGPVVLISRLFF